MCAERQSQVCRDLAPGLPDMATSGRRASIIRLWNALVKKRPRGTCNRHPYRANGEAVRYALC
jgi:hypothetical protein